MIINKERLPKIPTLLILSAFLLVHLGNLLLPHSFESWNLRAMDRLFSFRSNSIHFQPSYDDTIVHVDLNNTSIQRLKNFYLNRSHHAKLINNLAAMKVSIQLFDFIFAAPTAKDEDQNLLKAVSAAGNVYFGMAFELISNKDKSIASRQTSHENEYIISTQWRLKTKGDLKDMNVAGTSLITFMELASTAAGLGYVNLKADYDGSFRRLPLLIKVADGFYPSIAFRVICDYLDVSPGDIHIEPGKYITLKTAQWPGKSELEDIVIPIDRQGNMWVNFIGPWERMKHYHYVDVLQASEDPDDLEIWQEELSGKIVVISEVTTGSSDVGAVPTDTHFPLSGVHANAIHTILTGSFLKEISFAGLLLIEVVFMVLIAAMARYISSYLFIIFTMAVMGGYFFVWSFSFLYLGLILNIVRPAAMMTMALIMIVTYRYFNEQKEKSYLKQSFETYFPPSIVKKILSNPETLSTRGQKKELSILFSDIKNFTKHTEVMSPEQVQLLLNEYFELMTEIVFKYEGTLDKFIGDGMMVFFGDPEVQEDHAIRCIRAAIDMQRIVRQNHKEWIDQYNMPVQIRIGINTGPVVVGNMGSAKRMSYTALGAAVNLAQRLEANAPVGGILIAQRTYDLVNQTLPTKFVDNICVKGFADKMRVYEVSIE
ncbi:MAG: adenylate/guanylate cyclase domain-containing protein [Deltaproteobacteria bacterium]|nr:adenylate/guanylate cyclase domain-containing protein [Deltaproteobacteria bacterium]